MQLTSFTDLGLRIVMRLAVLDDDETATTSELAGQLNVRYTHAAKVVPALQKAGVIVTRRGRSGGMRLADGARRFSVGALVRELEGDSEVVTCEGTSPCPLRGGCRLRSALRQAQEAFLAALDPLTIDDITADPTASLLLTIGTAPAAPGPA